MYAMTAVYANGRVVLLGFVNNETEVNAMIDRMCREYGTEYLASAGVHFNIELAA